MKINKKAVVIFSGGLDSSTLLYMLTNQGFDVFPLTFNYGQRHSREVEHALEVLRKLGISERYRLMDLSNLTGDLFADSALTNHRIAIPDVTDKQNYKNSMKKTVVPFRNAVFLSLAVSYADSMNIDNVMYGAHFSDAGLYPDCSQNFVDAFDKLASIGTGNSRMTVEAPFVNWRKTDIVKYGASINVPFELTWSCYKGEDIHCGKCKSCNDRKEAFVKARVNDPTTYRF